jgi:hypothetical protein
MHKKLTTVYVPSATIAICRKSGRGPGKQKGISNFRHSVFILVLFVNARTLLPKLSSIMFLSIALVFAFACFKWFGPSSYLNSGPTWQSEVTRLRAVCKENPTEIVQATLSAGVAEIRCKNLTD